jgi:hypothetical protein
MLFNPTLKCLNLVKYAATELDVLGAAAGHSQFVELALTDRDVVGSTFRRNEAKALLSEVHWLLLPYDDTRTRPGNGQRS